jgi:hypothetical protein
MRVVVVFGCFLLTGCEFLVDECASEEFQVRVEIEHAVDARYQLEVDLDGETFLLQVGADQRRAEIDSARTHVAVSFDDRPESFTGFGIDVFASGHTRYDEMLLAVTSEGVELEEGVFDLDYDTVAECPGAVYLASATLRLPLPATAGGEP